MHNQMHVDHEQLGVFQESLLLLIARVEKTKIELYAS